MSAFVSVFVYDELMKSHCSWQPRPTWVVGFGALDQVLSEGTLWSRHWRYVRLQLEPGSFTKPSERLRSFKNDAHLDLRDVAIAFEGGEDITYGALLSAVPRRARRLGPRCGEVHDPAGNLSSKDSAAGIVRLLRLARRRSPRTPRYAGPFWGAESMWPPRKLPARPSMWVAEPWAPCL